MWEAVVGLAGVGAMDIYAEPAPWWLLQRVSLLDQLDALHTFMPLVHRSVPTGTPAQKLCCCLLLLLFVCGHWRSCLSVCVCMLAVDNGVECSCATAEVRL